jgi:NitT/TauT family transport system ATP-binding protein
MDTAMEPRPVNQSPAADVVRPKQRRIAMRGLRKRFTDIARQEEVVALDGVDLEIGDDEFLTVLGPSGCGKTTLLNIVAGFEEATSGEVRVDGEAIRKPGPDRGVVFQEYALFPWLTVEQNIEFGLRERGVRKARRRARVRQQIASVGLSGFGQRYPQELSGGMRQRVALARVLVNDPKILLMDEPFAALDAQTRSIMQQELLRVWSGDRRTAIFITHNIEEAILLGDRVVVMTARPGRIKDIVAVGLPRPRDVTSAEFNEIRRHIGVLLEAEVQATFAAMENIAGTAS